MPPLSSNDRRPFEHVGSLLHMHILILSHIFLCRHRPGPVPRAASERHACPPLPMQARGKIAHACGPKGPHSCHSSVRASVATTHPTTPFIVSKQRLRLPDQRMATHPRCYHEEPPPSETTSPVPTKSSTSPLKAPRPCSEHEEFPAHQKSRSCAQYHLPKAVHAPRSLKLCIVAPFAKNQG